MRTDDLIAALAADSGRRPPLARSIPLATLLGALVSLILFVLALGVRPDMAEALATWRFDLKLTIVAVALTLAAVDCVRSAGPVSAPVITRASLLVPALLAVGVTLELTLAPVEGWWPRLVGTNTGLCLTAIPALAIAPFLAAMVAMRSAAPLSPAAAGAAVGRLAAAVAAALYALHCLDDSPLFVATWYTLATLPVIAVGALGGRLMLRW